jgi:hypothetical protein
MGLVIDYHNNWVAGARLCYVWTDNGTWMVVMGFLAEFGISKSILLKFSLWRFYFPANR